MKRIWIPILSSVLIAALALCGIVLMEALGRQHLPPLPSPNGYDDLVSAGKSIVGRVGPFNSFNQDELRGMVSTNAEALRLLRLGLSRSCVPPSGGDSRSIPNYRSLAMLLAADGRLAEQDGRPDAAARSYLEVISLGSIVSDRGRIVHRLMGIAYVKMGGRLLVPILSKVDCSQLRPLITGLEKIDQETVSWAEVERNESRFVRSLLTKSNPIELFSNLWRSRGVNAAAKLSHQVTSAHVRLVTTELALRCFRCESGAPPKSLADLVPRYLAEVPADPFSSGHLAYRAIGTNWVLYSVGPNRTDDGGTRMKAISARPTPEAKQNGGQDKETAKGDLFFDSPW